MDSKAGERFVEEAFPIIMEEAIRKATDVNEKVCEWQPPEELKQCLDLDLREGGEASQQILKRCKDVIKYSVKTGKPIHGNIFIAFQSSKFKTPEYANVCFWYIPPSLRNIPDGPEFWKKLHQVAPVIKERMMKKGSMMVGYQPHRDKVNFFRQIIISPQVSREDMDFVLQEIEALGKDL
ncbi:UNVERIFIED_CONTAM: hypothetical protein FKN15_047937 [Acipenser sinensis]